MQKIQNQILIDWPQPALEDIPGVWLQRRNSVKDATFATDRFNNGPKDQGVNPGLLWPLFNSIQAGFILLII